MRQGGSANRVTLRKFATTPTALAILLAVGFGVLYFAVGLGWIRNGLIYCFNAYFNTDTTRVIDDVTSIEGIHRRTVTHPIFPLLMAPLGAPLRLILPPATATLLLGVFAAALAIFLVFRTLATFTAERDALALSFVYGSTASCLIMFSTTETFVWSALGIAIATYAVRAERGPLWHGASAVGLFGVLASNLLHIFAAHLLYPAPSRWRERAVRGACWVTIAIVGVCFLAVLQSYLFPRAHVFLAPQDIAGEWAFAPTLSLWGRLLRIADLGAHYFEFSLVAPAPHYLRRNDLGVDWVTFWQRPSGHFASYPLWTWPAVALMNAVLGWATYVNVKFARHTVEVRVVTLTLFAHFAMFVVYGDDFTLYTPLWVIQWMMWIALALHASDCRGAWRPTSAHLGLVGAVMLTSNVAGLSNIARHFEGAIPCEPHDRACVVKYYRPAALRGTKRGPRFRDSGDLNGRLQRK
jgi:hypothetical protein